MILIRREGQTSIEIIFLRARRTIQYAVFAAREAPAPDLQPQPVLQDRPIGIPGHLTAITEF
ncbi:hypothetical protein D3C81_2195560 [compost metagenome]